MRNSRTHRLPAAVLAVSLALPAPAFALRQPNPKDSPPIEKSLRAGLEEGQPMPAGSETVQMARKVWEKIEELIRRSHKDQKEYHIFLLGDGSRILDFYEPEAKPSPFDTGLSIDTYLDRKSVV